VSSATVKGCSIQVRNTVDAEPLGDDLGVVAAVSGRDLLWVAE
jgi:hypothetical protein